MKIAILVTAHLTMPAGPGIIWAPMELAVTIGKHLEKAGHDITFYAPKGTNLGGLKVKSYDLPPLRKNLTDRSILEKLQEPFSIHTDKIDERIKIYWDQYLLVKMYEAAERGEHDAVHVHLSNTAAMPIAYAHPNIPTVYTLHDPLYPWRARAYEMFSSKNQYLVSISNTQRLAAPNLSFAATIYNGIRLEDFPYSEKGGDSFIWVGRIIPEKNPIGAIKAARKAGAKLILFGQIINKKFWEEEVRPLLGEGITYGGNVPRETLYRHYQKAKAFIFPLIWEEPFGLVVTEAMACGTPVIAFKHGSMPELITHGKTGYLVDTIPQMAAAMKKIDLISRADCRAHVEKKFTTEKMVSEYENLFKKILKVK